MLFELLIIRREGLEIKKAPPGAQSPVGDHFLVALAIIKVVWLHHVKCFRVFSRYWVYSHRSKIIF